MKACVSIVEPSLESALGSCRKAIELGADLLELRFDHLDSLPSDLAPFKELTVPMIATLRPKGRGGKYEGSEEERTKFFRRAMRSGFQYLDLESDSSLISRRDRDFRNAGIIASYHDFAHTPSTSMILDILISSASKADITKAAFNTASIKDLLSIAQAAKLFSATEGHFVLIGMGELGEITRVRAQKMGCAFAYASLEKGKEAAPGQIDVATLKDLGDDPILTGITGSPLSHSRSPAMHNAAFAELGIKGRYFKLPAAEEELGDLMELMTALDMRGLNVTIPHKESMISLVDELDPVAEKVGAVNTILNKDGTLIGKNTDVSGLKAAFAKASVEMKGKNALVIGAGGAARACCYLLSEEGASLSITNRTMQKAQELADRFGGKAVDAVSASSLDLDIVINCTPLGMTGFADELPISPSIFKSGMFVMDLIYDPQRTRFLEEAEAKGATIMSGMEMLIYQAIDAFEVWTGQRPSYDTMAEAFMAGNK